MNLQDIVNGLQAYWSRQGCLIVQPYDLEVGAGTMHPETFFRVLKPAPWRVAYTQPSRRPADGRYGDNPFRLYKHLQYQVILKPSPENVQDLYLGSLEQIGIDLKRHDIRFEEDNWEAPTLGAWGVGWQVMLDGMEISQFTYFQQSGGVELNPISVELTYGLERITMYLTKSQSIYDIPYNDTVAYRDVRLWEEREMSAYYFDTADVEELWHQFSFWERECEACLSEELLYPAYEGVLKMSHLFNVLDARGVISVTQRASAIGRIRNLAVQCAHRYLDRDNADTGS
ncbi:MAG TPA: glycine--tRNA ligase subunit alpha [Thermoanaerobaculia bacterium]|nr:glycine--tRNA ligase subunit alpha [Thermoanaerobaculia bacterium]HUM29007.1 glycine--tRNA ligase subunit alpha [Thermoanaerobaculia bacterium]HXK67437.1 glycine--tRNA ligase subunit alpha [Thermoanaerobaculia bacterium]